MAFMDTVAEASQGVASWFADLAPGGGVPGWLPDPSAAIATYGVDPGSAVAAKPDPVGDKDRARAAAELRDRFQVVDEHAGVDRLPNQVTAEEYAEICKLYSDVRLGRGDLTLDTSEMVKGSQQERDFRAGAMNDLAAMLQTSAGRDLVRGLSNNVVTDQTGEPQHRATTLHALHTDMNADGDRGNDGNAIVDISGAMADPRNLGMMGMPGGTDCDVRYNPGYPIAGIRSDVALFHEMKHAYDMTRGRADTDVVRAGDGVAGDALRVQQFEHQAVGVGKYAGAPLTENEYRRQRAVISSAELPGALPGDRGMKQRASYAQDGHDN